MFEPRPLGLGRGHRSDRHGVIERHPTLASAGPFLDPGDLAADRSVEEHGAQVSALRHRRAQVQRRRPRKQARSPRRQAVSHAPSRGGQVAQGEADGQAVARRSSRPRLRGFLQSGGGVRPRVEGRSAARATDLRSRRFRAAGVHAGRGFPVRLVRRLGDHRRRADQIAGRALQALLQPCLHAPGLPATNP